MPERFQELVLSASDVCSNCFGRLRREAIRPRKYGGDETYEERLRWRTTVDDVPDTVVHEQQQLFCECGAGSPFTRIWDDNDVLQDTGRLDELLVSLLRTLLDAGAVSTRDELETVARRARQELARVPDPETYGPFQEGRPLTVNDALATAVAAARHDDHGARGARA